MRGWPGPTGVGKVISRPLLRLVVGERQGFADGSARFLDARTEEATLRALITRDGGEPVDVSMLP